MKSHAKDLNLNQFTYNGKPLKGLKYERNMTGFLATHCRKIVKKTTASLHVILKVCTKQQEENRQDMTIKANHGT